MTNLHLAVAVLSVVVVEEAEIRKMRACRCEYWFSILEFHYCFQNRNQLFFPNGQIQMMPTLEGYSKLKNPFDTQTCSYFHYCFFRIAPPDNFQ